MGAFNIGSQIPTPPAQQAANNVTGQVNGLATNLFNAPKNAVASLPFGSNAPQNPGAQNGAQGSGMPSAAAPPAPQTQDPLLAGPGYQEDFYKTHGQDLINTPSASEDLYAQGAAGSNPFYDYAQQQTIKAINDASAARGNGNSSYTMHNIGNAVADLRGQQAHELGQLAGQADQSKFGRYDRTNDYADTAQRNLTNRATGAVNGYTSLANDQADKVGGFYGEAGKETTATAMASIEAALKKSGMSQAEMDKWMNNLFSGLKIGAAGA